MRDRAERSWDIEDADYVCSQEAELRAARQVRDVLSPSGREVIDAENLIAPGDQGVAQMRAEKPGAAGNEHPHVSSSWLCAGTATDGGKVSSCAVPMHRTVQPAVRQRSCGSALRAS